MQVDLSSNYFALFGFAVEFELDTQLLGKRWQELQRSLHPDRFVSASDAERRYSMQAASLVNEAHKVLATPLARAAYLLKLRDIDLDVETDTRMAPEFLMEQMELREQLDEVNAAADPYARIDSIRSVLKDMGERTEASFKQCYTADDMVSARDAVRQWQFIDKLQREVSDLEADLDDA
ncbi:MAG: Fe-S protein assembly co-chaperone HscB [Granulosicoccus sp.]|nr:Fe-S protein assembly co-chaperone HscB [Granulosicoccus sp.]